MENGAEQRVSVAVPPLGGELAGRPVRITIAGCYSHLADHRVRKRQLMEWVLLLCVQGQGWARRGTGEDQPLANGQGVLLPPGVPHSYGSLPRDPWTVLWLHCTGPGVPALAGRAGDGNVFAFSPEAPALAREALRHLRAGLGTPNVLCAEAALTRLLALLGTGEQVGAPLPLPVVRAQALLQDLAHPLDLEAIARRVGLSKYHLVRQFRRWVGETPMEYRGRLRLARACDLLADPQNTLARISETLGYSSPYHFSAAFKERYGIAPSAFRRLL